MVNERLFGSFHCTREQVGDLVYVALKGELDLVSVAEFRAFVEEDMRGKRDVLFDLRDVSYMDSVAIRMLLRVHRTLSDRKQRMAVVQPPSLARRILDIAGIGNVIPIFGSVQEALLYLRHRRSKKERLVASKRRLPSRASLRHSVSGMPSRTDRRHCRHDDQLCVPGIGATGADKVRKRDHRD